MLEPVQHAIGGKIVSSRLISTPDKMEVALKANPWDVLRDIRPFEFASQHIDPVMGPIMFVHDGRRYIGWQMRGMLPVMFNCEWHDLPELHERTPRVTPQKTSRLEKHSSDDAARRQRERRLQDEAMHKLDDDMAGLPRSRAERLAKMGERASSNEIGEDDGAHPRTVLSTGKESSSPPPIDAKRQASMFSREAREARAAMKAGKEKTDKEAVEVELARLRRKVMEDREKGIIRPHASEVSREELEVAHARLTKKVMEQE